MKAGPLVVIGDTLLDVDLDGTAGRLAPDAPVPVVDCEQERHRPGGAGLAAVLAAALGADLGGPDVVLVTALGEDSQGARLRELLAGQVETLVLPLRGGTPCKIRVRASGQPLLRLDAGDGRARGGPVGAAAERALRAAGGILVSDYGRGMAAHLGLRAILAGLRGTPVVWDPHPRGELPVPGARLVTPNQDEARRLAGTIRTGPRATGPPETGERASGERASGERASGERASGERDAGQPGTYPPETGAPAAGAPDAGAPDAGRPGACPPEAGMPKAGMLEAGVPKAGMPEAGMPDGTRGPFGRAARDAAALSRAWGTAVAVTLGPRGALLSVGDDAPFLAPPPAMASGPADTCGAGDCFAAAAAQVIRAGGLLSEAVTEAVRLASGFVSSGGVAAVPGRTIPSRAGSSSRRRPAPGESAWELAASVRQAGGRVVATGGCFDLLHAGHVELLRQGRRLGDCLIVCLNSDSSVRALKGPGRPLVRAADRARVLAALECVDAVLEFGERTPSAVLERLRPDIWVKGGDYSREQLTEAAVVRRYGGEVVLLPYHERHSTSRIVAAARTGASG